MAYTTNPRLPKVRMEAVRLVNYRGWSMRKVSRHTGYHHTTIGRWCGKDPTGGWRQIPTRSSRPRSHPKQLEEDIVQRIVAKRLKIRRCAEVVHQELKNDGVLVSLSSVKRTLDRKNLINKRSPWKRYHAPQERPHAEKQGELVQIDTIHLQRPDGTRVYIYTLLDVYSRWTYAKAVERINCRQSLLFVKEAQIRSPFQFNHLQTDHGSEFSTNFTERVGVRHRHSRVRKPNDNAHLERFNRTLQDECLTGLKLDTRILNGALKEYVPYYNTKRLHLGINLKSPSQLLTV